MRTITHRQSSKGLDLPSKTGVGLARKIAADVALKLISDGKIKTTWVHCTDADVILPTDYFIFTNKIQNCSAAIYPYFHKQEHDDELRKKSMLLYELSLRHYVNGLLYAKSNYAHHTIGSTIAVDLEAYAKVRGFPARESGEDFYILNKLSKIGRIKKISGGENNHRWENFIQNAIWHWEISRKNIFDGRNCTR